jgi:LTXXQ motif family protein
VGALLDELKVATQQAVEILRSACPTDLPTTSTGRMAAMRVRVEMMLRAVQVVRPVLEKFYASLSDEQKERFNTLDAANLQTASAKRQQPEIAHVCSGRAARVADVPVARIERTLYLSDAQEDALRELIQPGFDEGAHHGATGFLKRHGGAGRGRLDGQHRGGKLAQHFVVVRVALGRDSRSARARLP